MFQMFIDLFQIVAVAYFSASIVYHGKQIIVVKHMELRMKHLEERVVKLKRIDSESQGKMAHFTSRKHK